MLSEKIHMSTITRQTLAFAIYSIVFNQCLIADRLDALPEGADDEHLDDTILNMERSIGELHDLYSEFNDQLRNGDSFDELCANAERDYRSFIVSVRPSHL